MKICLKKTFWERISKFSNVDVIKLQDSDVGYVIQFLVLTFL
jgi:hypothetical protein